MQGLRGLSKAKMVATLERGQHLNVQGNGLSWGNLDLLVIGQSQQVI